MTPLRVICRKKSAAAGHSAIALRSGAGNLARRVESSGAGTSTEGTDPDRTMPKTSASLFAFFGTDDARVKEAALRLSEKIAPRDDEFALEVVSGGADNTEDAVRIVGRTIEAIQTLPFFGGEKVVWLQGANFFGDSQTAKSQSTLGAVESLVALFEAGLPSDVKVIISAGEIDKRRSFYKKVNKIGKVEIFDKEDTSKQGWEEKVGVWVAERARQRGIAFAPGAQERFVLMIGSETRLLDSEMEKLGLFAGDRPVTEDDVDEVCAATHTGAIFEIGDAIARRDLPRALELIDRQMRRGESPIGILLAAIVPRVRSLLHARDLVTRHRLRVGRSYKAFEGEVNALPGSETAHLPRKKDGGISAYPLFLAAQVSNRFTVEELRDALDACLEANSRLVTTQLDARLVLDQLVARILGDRSS